MSPSDRTEAAVVTSIKRDSGKLSGEDGRRIVAAQLAMDYYRSVTRQAEDLTATYRHLYDSSSDWETRPKTCYNLMRAVVGKMATLYHDPVRRKFDDESRAKQFAEMREWTATMQDVDAYAWVAGMVGVRPVTVEPGQPPRLVLYPSTMLTYVPMPDDPTTPQQVTVSYKLGDQTKRLHWTAEEFMAELDDQVIDGPKPNRYGRIPISFFRNSIPRWGFFDEPGTDLVVANRVLNNGMTTLNYTTDFQSSSLLVTKGGDESKALKIGPRRRLNIPDPAGDAFFISPSPNISQLIEAINLNLRLFLASRDIPEDALMLQRQGESGVAIVARQVGLSDIRKRRINSFRPAEEDLIYLAALVADTDAVKAIPQVFVPELTYREPKLPMDAETQATRDWNLRNNLATVPDFLMEDDPTLSEEDAKKKHAENTAYNRTAGGGDERRRLLIETMAGKMKAKPGEKYEEKPEDDKDGKSQGADDDGDDDDGK